MTQPDQHDRSADALKALAAGEQKPQAGSADGFVGPEPPEEDEDGAAGHEPIHAVLAPGQARTGPPELPLAGAEAFVPDPAARSRHTAAFNQRERLAHAHQYKAIMIPLLITLGVILLLMAAYAVSRGGTVQVEADGVVQEQPAEGLRKWFPVLAFPMGAILLMGAWLFHRDVSGKKA